MTSATEVRDQLQDILSSEYRESALNNRMHFLLLDVKFLRNTLLHNLTFELSKQPDIPAGPFSVGFTKSKTAFNPTAKTGAELAKSVRPEAIKNINDFARTLSAYVKAKHKNTTSVTQILSNSIDLLTTELPLVVLDGEDVVGVLYSSFNSTYTGLFKDFLNKYLTELISDAGYEARKLEKKLKSSETSDISKVYDVGHLVSSGVGEEASIISPAIYKINALISSVQKTIEKIESDQSKSSRLNILTRALKNIEKTKKSLIKSSGYGSFAIKILKSFKYETNGVGTDLLQALNKVEAVVVFPQDALENRYIYGTKVEGKAINLVKKLIGFINFSRNLVEEIPYVLGEALAGRKPKSTSKTVNISGKLKLPKPPKISTSVSSSGKAAKYTPKQVLLPEVTLLSLQNLINANLAEKIKENMGGGSSRTLLNNRTGRLAESAQVERMSESRAGMITAFYSYMKNPYATFSAGGRQQDPKSRDPKLLIAKSIREIAAQQVGNRLRSVLV